MAENYYSRYKSQQTSGFDAGGSPYEYYTGKKKKKKPEITPTPTAEAQPEPQPAKRSILQRMAEYAKGQVSFAVKHPVEAAKTVGKALIESERRFGETIATPFVTGFDVGPIHVKGTAGEQVRQTQENIAKQQRDIRAAIDRSLEAAKTKEQKNRILQIKRNYNQQVSKMKPVDFIEELPSLNKTTAQVLAEAGGVALDIALFGMGGTALRAGKPVLKLGTKEIIKRGITKRTMGEAAALGAGFGLTGAAQEGAKGKELLLPTAIGALSFPAIVAGGVLTAATGRAIINKIFRKALPEAPALAVKAGEKAKVEPAAITGQQAQTIQDFIINQPNLKIRQTSTLGKDLNNRNIVSRLEWNANEKSGIIYVTPNATDGNLAHEIGHYLDKTIDPATKEIYLKEAQALVGTNLTPNETFAQSVARLIVNPKDAEKAPQLAKFLQDLKIQPPQVPTEIPVVRPPKTKVAMTEAQTDVKIAETRMSELVKEEAQGMKQIEEMAQVGMKPTAEGGYVRYSEHTPEYRAYFQKYKHKPPLSFYENLAKEKLQSGRGQFQEEYNSIQGFLKSAGKEVTAELKPVRAELKTMKEIIKPPAEEKVNLPWWKYIKPEKSTYKKPQITGPKDVFDLTKGRYKLTKDFDIIPITRSEADKLSGLTISPEKGLYAEAVTKIATRPNATGLEGWYIRVGEPKFYDLFKKGLNDKEKAQIALYNQIRKSNRAFTGEKSIEQAIKEIPPIKREVIPITKEVVGAEEIPTARLTALEREAEIPVAPYKAVTTGLPTPAEAVPSKVTAPGVKPVAFAEIKTPAYNPSKINAPDDVRALIDATHGQFQKQRRGTITNEQLKEMAFAAGVKPEDIMKAKPGAIVNPENALAARQIQTDMALQLRELVSSIKGPATQEQLTNLKSRVSDLKLMNEAIAGIRTEYGRGLGQFKMEVMPGENDILQDLLGKLRNIDTESANLLDFAKGTAKELKAPGLVDTIFSGFYASILSGPSTHTKNFVDTGINTIMDQAVEAIRHPANIRNQLPKLAYGFKEGWIAFREVMAGKRMVYDKWDLSKPNTRNWLTKKFEIVGKALKAADAVWLETNKEANKATIAYDLIRKEKGMIAAVAETRKFLVDPLIHPQGEKWLNKIYDQSLKEALRSTYNQKIPEGAVGAVAQGISTATNKVKPLKFIVPFTRIVANVLNVGIDWSPYGFKRSLVVWRKAGEMAEKQGFKSLASGEFAGREAQQAFGRATLGTLGMIYAYSLAQAGIITGSGPTSANQRKQLEAQGWKRNSLKIGNKYIEYKYLGPFAIPMALVANYVDAKKYGALDDKELTEKFSYAFFGTINTILDMSFLSGLGSLATAIQYNDEKYLKRFPTGIAASFYPNLLKQIGLVFEKTKKDPQSFGDYFLYQLGYPFRAGIRPRLDVFGEPVQETRPFWSKFSGSSITPEVQNSLTPLMNKLIDNQVRLTIPTKQTKIEDPRTGEKRKMTDDELYKYKEIFGQSLKLYIGYNKDYLVYITDPDELESEVKDIISQAKSDAQDKMLLYLIE